MSASMGSLIKRFSRLTKNYTNVKGVLPWTNNVQCQEYAQVSFYSSSDPKSQFPERPRQPATAFLKYLEQKRDGMRKSNPGMKPNEISQKVAVLWKNIPQGEKQIYKDKYNGEFMEFKTLKDQWWNNLTPSQREAYLKCVNETKQQKEDRAIKKKLRLLGKPKRSLSAFNFFVHVSHPDSKIKFGDVAHKWKNLSDEDKKPFVEMALKDSKRYESEMKSWELKMLREGHEDFLQPSKRRHSIPHKLTSKSVETSEGDEMKLRPVRRLRSKMSKSEE